MRTRLTSDLMGVPCAFDLLPLEPRRYLAADLVMEWNQVLLDALQADTTLPGPGWSSRNMAIVSAAVFDTVNAFDHSYDSYLVHRNSPRGASMDSAIAAAAHWALIHLYPDQQDRFDDALQASLADVPDGAGEHSGILFGRFVAHAILRARQNDGSERIVPYEPDPAPGHWQPDVINPDQVAWGPGWGQVEPFVLKKGKQFRPPPPPSLTSAEYTAAFNEVKELGAKDSATRTAEQTEIGVFWGYDRTGTGTPPMHYNQVVRAISIQEGNTVVENARLIFLTSAAMADAGIAAWDAKFAYDLWRPITGIRRAGEDGNPGTIADPDWEPLGAPGGGVVTDFTPPFPAYPSGHSTFGGALFETLRQFYGTDEMNFTLTSDEMPGVTRSYSSFSQAALENGRSRIYLGIHWNFDDTVGRALGSQVGDWVFDHVGEPVKSHHHGPHDGNHDPHDEPRLAATLSRVADLVLGIAKGLF